MALLVLSKAGLFKRSCRSKLRINAHILFYYNTLTENIFSNNSLGRRPVLDPVRVNVYRSKNDYCRFLKASDKLDFVQTSNLGDHIHLSIGQLLDP